MDPGLSGRIALVTGASAGIGRATAAALVAEGARVAISSRSKDRIASAAEAIGATGLVWDSADLDAVPALVSSVAEALDGPVEVLVCNTGGPPFGPTRWRSPAPVGGRAPDARARAAGARAGGPPRDARPALGAILNVGSTSVREPIAHLMLSNAERSAALAAFKTLARQVAGDGCTLNTVLPGRILTDRQISVGGRPRRPRRLLRAWFPPGEPARSRRSRRSRPSSAATARPTSRAPRSPWMAACSAPSEPSHEGAHARSQFGRQLRPMAPGWPK